MAESTKYLTRRQIAHRLRGARLDVGLSQDAAAQALNIHRVSITELEAGRRSVKAEELYSLCELYRVSVAEILSTDEDFKNEPDHTIRARDDWRYHYLLVNPDGPRIVTQLTTVPVAMARVQDVLTNLQKPGTAGVYIGTESALAIRTVLEFARDAESAARAAHAAGVAEEKAQECVWTVIPYHEGSYLIAACEAQTAMPLDRRHTLCPCCGGKVRIEGLRNG